MKKIILILVSSLLIGFVGCGDDDKNDLENNIPPLEGTIWAEHMNSEKTTEILFYKDTCHYSYWDIKGGAYVNRVAVYKYEVIDSEINFIPTHYYYYKMNAIYKNGEMIFERDLFGSRNPKTFTKRKKEAIRY